MAVLLEFPRLHQLSTTNHTQVDQTFTVGYIFEHIFIQRSFNELNKPENFVMYAIENRFEVIVPSSGITQLQDLSAHRSLDAYFCFNI